MEIAVERSDLLQHLGRHLRRMTTDLEQREDERGEFMPHRDAGEANGDLRVAGAADQEAGAARIVVGAGDADLVRQRGDIIEQGRQLGRFGIVAERRDEFDRFTKVREEALKLLLQIGVEHGESSCERGREKSRVSPRKRGPRAGLRLVALGGSGLPPSGEHAGIL